MKGVVDSINSKSRIQNLRKTYGKTAEVYNEKSVLSLLPKDIQKITIMYVIDSYISFNPYKINEMILYCNTRTYHTTTNNYDNDDKIKKNMYEIICKNKFYWESIWNKYVSSKTPNYTQEQLKESSYLDRLKSEIFAIMKSFESGKYDNFTKKREIAWNIMKLNELFGYKIMKSTSYGDITLQDSWINDNIIKFNKYVSRAPHFLYSTIRRLVGAAYTKLLKLVLDNGGNINVEDSDGSTVILDQGLFLYKNEPQMLKIYQFILDNGININHVNNFGLNVFNTFDDPNINIKLYGMLLKKGNCLESEYLSKNSSKDFSEDSFKKLCEKADVNHQDITGATVLVSYLKHTPTFTYGSIYKDHPTYIECLLNPEKINPDYNKLKGVDPNIVNNEGESALILAIKNKYYETVNVLLKYKADINYIDKNGDTALFYLLKNYVNGEHIKNYNADYSIDLKGIKKIVENNAINLNYVNNSKFSVLNLITKKIEKDVLKLFKKTKLHTKLVEINDNIDNDTNNTNNIDRAKIANNISSKKSGIFDNPTLSSLTKRKPIVYEDNEDDEDGENNDDNDEDNNYEDDIYDY